MIKCRRFNHPICKTCPEEIKRHCLTPGDPGPLCTEKLSEMLWGGRRVWYPPWDPNGRYYRTVYVGKTEKDGLVTVTMKLIPEEE